MARGDDEESRGFKVVDRRLFDEQGEEREDVPEPGPAPADGAEPGEGSGPGSVTPPGATDASAAAGAGTAPADSAAPPLDLDLGSFIKSLLVAGLFQVGALAEEGREPQAPDGLGGRQSLNTLLMLQRKTAGNLSADEEQLFRDAISEMVVALAMRVLLPEVARALGLDQDGRVDGDAARAGIDELAATVERVRDVARADAVQTLEGALADLRLQFVSRVGS